MDRFSSSVNRWSPVVTTVYTGPHSERAHVLQALAVADARWRNEVSILAGRVLLISTLILGFLL